MTYDIVKKLILCTSADSASGAREDKVLVEVRCRRKKTTKWRKKT